MKFLRALPCLVSCALLGAQGLVMKPDGGGELKIGTAQYAFEPANFSAAAAKEGLPGALRLEGALKPRGGGQPFHLVLTVLKDGTLYLLRLERRAQPKAAPDTLAATLRTRVRLLRLEDRPGGRVELRCEGPLSGVLDNRIQEVSWSGTLWVVFPGN